MTRHRGIQDEEELMMLILFYVCGHSLVEVTHYAKVEFGTAISDVGFMKRFNRCNEWVKSILEQMLDNEIIRYDIPEKLKGYKVIAVDGSDVRQKGAVQKEFHLHYAVNLFTLSSESFKITPQQQGETLKNFLFGKDTIVIGDRAYASITGIKHCSAHQTDFILRIKNKAFKLYNKNGEEIELSTVLKGVTEQSCDFILYYKQKEELKPIRFCAVKKTKEEIEIEKKCISRKESKKQKSLSDDTKFTHEYFFVITSLGNNFTSDEILNLYKLRWQVEMVFKRYKSILDLGSIPTKTGIAGQVWLNCKMLIALLIEKILSSVDFPPCADSSEYMEGNEHSEVFDFNSVLYNR
ncbi:MAG: transposase [Clostridia bacterium]|nr:transposase [Clostridia bacterium]